MKQNIFRFISGWTRDFMRLIITCFVVVTMWSCHKGKKLPETIYVAYQPASGASISPEDHFAPIDPYDVTEPWIYPSYVNYYTSAEIEQEFSESLEKKLKGNNIILTQDSAVYKLVIGSLQLSEKLNWQSYYDSCMGTTSKVYYSDLEFDAHASLFKEGVLIDTWSRAGMSSGRVKGKTNKCNEPKTRGPVRGVSSLIDQVAGEIRMKISRSIYLSEGY